MSLEDKFFANNSQYLAASVADFCHFLTQALCKNGFAHAHAVSLTEKYLANVMQTSEGVRMFHEVLGDR